MSSIQPKQVCSILCFCLASSATALGGTLCVTDDSNNTIVLKTDSDLAAAAIVGLHGWLSDGTVTVPLHGTAVVNSDGTGVKVEIQGINNVRHQHLGIVLDTDLLLNGSGTFENVNAGRPYVYEIIPVTWTALDSCPNTPPFAPSGKDARVYSGDGTTTPPRNTGKN